MKHRIVDIHPEDAFYDIRDKLIGKEVRMSDMVETEFEGYVQGDAFLYIPVEMSWGDLSNIPFAYVKVEEI